MPPPSYFLHPLQNAAQTLSSMQTHCWFERQLTSAVCGLIVFYSLSLPPATGVIEMLWEPVSLCWEKSIVYQEISISIFHSKMCPDCRWHAENESLLSNKYTQQWQARSCQVQTRDTQEQIWNHFSGGSYQDNVVLYWALGIVENRQPPPHHITLYTCTCQWDGTGIYMQKRLAFLTTILSASLSGISDRPQSLNMQHHLIFFEVAILEQAVLAWKSSCGYKWSKSSG